MESEGAGGEVVQPQAEEARVVPEVAHIQGTHVVVVPAGGGRAPGPCGRCGRLVVVVARCSRRSAVVVVGILLHGGGGVQDGCGGRGGNRPLL